VLQALIVADDGLTKRVARESKKYGKEVYFWPDIQAVQNALTAVQDYLAAQH
jgi:hypothetical protein